MRAAERWPRTRHLGLPQALRCTAQHSTAQHSSSSSAAAQQQQRSSTAAAAQQHSSTAQHSLKPAPPGLPCCLPRGRTSPVTPQVDMQWNRRHQPSAPRRRRQLQRRGDATKLRQLAGQHLPPQILLQQARAVRCGGWRVDCEQDRLRQRRNTKAMAGQLARRGLPAQPKLVPCIDRRARQACKGESVVPCGLQRWVHARVRMRT